MRTFLQVLSEDERDRVHETTLKVLAQTGLRVDTVRGRQILKEAGAEVNEETGIVRFPRALVEESLRLAPKQFALGGRRPDWALPLNAGECTLLADGGAVFMLDPETGERRPGTFDDWLTSTRLIDAIDEIGAYWWMVEGGFASDSAGDFVAYWRNLLSNFSKHIQDSTNDPEQSRWLLEVFDVVFGRECVRTQRPFSFLLCPLSPLVIEGPFTDAYLETLGWDIPVAVMPMPLMGTTAPASLISTVVLGNCETLAMLCLIQAAAPGTPFIYAPALAVMEPRSGRYGSGSVEHTLLGAASTEMARYYGLPVEASTGGTDHHIPGIQAGYERAVNWLLPVLAWPDLLVGPGLLGGSMILSLEQLMIDVEVFKLCRRVHQGIGSEGDKWLEDVIASVGPGGNFLAQRSTKHAIRTGEWYISRLGVHDTYERWEELGRPDLLDEIKAKVRQILAEHTPLPLEEATLRELEHIERRARELG